jgi:hypothetical protein
LLVAPLAVVVACVLSAPPAFAVVTKASGTSVGLQPRAIGLSEAWKTPETFTNENGNVVLHGTSDYAVYWDPKKQMHHEWVTKLDTFFHSLGEASVATGFGILAEYRDRSNVTKPFKAVFKGAYSDTSKFPAEGCTDPNPLTEGAGPCLTDAQLREQLKSFISSHGLPTGMSTVYFLITPPGVTVCLDATASHCSDYGLSVKEEAEEHRESTSYKNSFCSYHGDINPNGTPNGDESTILYAAIPWTAGTLGLKGYQPKARLYEEAFDCQDGGFYPSTERKEEEEIAPLLTKEEEEKIAKLPPKEREEAEEAHRLKGPHQQEPNQEGKGEGGDYSPGLSDLLVNQIGEEEVNTVTNPLLQSWHDAVGDEATDLCRNWFAATAGTAGSIGEIAGSPTADPHTKAGMLSNTTVGGGRFYINNVFNLAAVENGLIPCSGGVALVPRFTAPNSVNAGEVISVDGMESTVGLITGKAFGPSGPPTTTYATFGWTFGDGTPEATGYAPGAPTCEFPWLSPCAASALHSYQYGGTYNVTLRIVDVAGNTTSVTHPVTVVGPPPPSSPAEAGSGSTSSPGASSTSGGSGASSGASTSSTHVTPVPPPVAAAAIASRSLRRALRGGLLIRYSVNEQVAGHLEVLLSRAIARRLGIGGSPAFGLPAGTPPQVIIGRAILVTTSAGRSTVDIQFGKRTAARLARLHSVPLMLRLFVRNAASRSPATTTVLSTVTLSH